MYSWEIDNILKNSNYTIDADTYFHICNTSPQISWIKFNPYSNEYETRTDDGYYWNYKVINKL